MSSFGGGVVARLRCVLGLDTQEFEAGISKAKGGAKSFQSSLKDVAGALGIAFSVGAVVSFGKSFMDWAGKISDASTNVGILTKDMLALNSVAIKNGVGVEDLTKMFSRIEEEVFGAANGTSKLADIYGVLGYSIEQLVQMRPEERFIALTKAALESSNATGALAQLFGQKLGPKARAALTEIVEGLDAVSAAEGRMVDKLDAAGDKWAGYLNNAKMALLPILGWLGEANEDITDFIAAMAQPGTANPMKLIDEFTRIRDERHAAEKKAAAKSDADRVGNPQDMINAAAATAKKKNDAEMSKGDKSVADIEEETKKLRDARLSGMEKLKADMLAKEREIDKAVAETGNYFVKIALEDQRAEVRRQYALAVKDLEAEAAKKKRIATGKRDEKLQAAQDKLGDSVLEARDRAAERIASIQENTRGRGINPDSMAQIGGFFGGERAGLADRDRTLQVQTETKKAMVDLTKAVNEMKTAYDNSVAGINNEFQLGGVE